MLNKLISGGQPGVDRGALNAAIDLGVWSKFTFFNLI